MRYAFDRVVGTKRGVVKKIGLDNRLHIAHCRCDGENANCHPIWNNYATYEQRGTSYFEGFEDAKCPICGGYYWYFVNEVL